MTEQQLTPEQAEHQSRVLGLASLWLGGDDVAYDLAMATVKDAEDARALLSASNGVLEGLYQIPGLDAPEELRAALPDEFDALLQALADRVGAICVIADAIWRNGAREMLRQMAYRAAYEGAKMAE